MRELGIFRRYVICVVISFFLTTSLTSFVKLEAAEKTDAQDSSLSIEAWDFYYDKEFDKAIELFAQEAKQHSDWCDPYDGLGWSHLQKGDFKKAEEYFQKALKIYYYYQNSLTGMAEINAWKYRKFNRAWAYYYAENFDKAVEIFNDILTEKGERLPTDEFWRVRTGLAWSHFGRKEYDEAIMSFRKVLEEHKDNSDAIKGVGLAYFEKGDLDKSLEYLQQSLTILAYQPEIQSKIAWIYNKKADFKKAIEEFERAKKLNPYLAEPYKGLGWSYLAVEDYKKAKENFIQGIKIYPGYLVDEQFKEVLKKRKDWRDIYKILGWSYYNYGLYTRAREEFESASKELGDDPEILRGTGYVLYKLGDYDKAINSFRKSLKLDPKLPPVDEYVQIPGTKATYLIKSDAQSSLGWALYQKEKYKEAVKQFQEVISRHPNWIDAHDGLGWTYFMMKDYENAGKAFREGLTFNPSYADMLNGLAAINQAKFGKSGLGWSLYYRGNYKTALQQFIEVLKGKGADFPKEQLWSIHSGMGWCYYRLGDFGKAEKEFNLVLKEKGDNIDALVGLGYVLFQKKNYQRTIDNLIKALKSSPQHYDALTTLGWSYYKTKKFAKASDTFKKAVAINTYLVDPYFGLGLSYYRNKDYDEAKETLGIAIDIYPDYVMTDEFKEILKKQKNWVDLYSRFGWSYYYKGLFDKASEMFARQLKEDSTNKDALLGLGSIYFHQGDYKAVISKLEPLLSGKPPKEKGWYKWSHVLNNLGWSYFYIDNYDKALNYFNEILALHEDDIYADPYSGIGWCLFKKGDKEGAKEKFLKAVKLAPGYISAVNGLAEADKME